MSDETVTVQASELQVGDHVASVLLTSMPVHWYRVEEVIATIVAQDDELWITWGNGADSIYRLNHEVRIYPREQKP